MQYKLSGQLQLFLQDSAILFPSLLQTSRMNAKFIMNQGLSNQFFKGYCVEAYIQKYSITKFYPYSSENTLKLKYLDNGKYYAAVNKN